MIANVVLRFESQSVAQCDVRTDAPVIFNIESYVNLRNTHARVRPNAWIVGHTGHGVLGREISLPEQCLLISLDRGKNVAAIYARGRIVSVGEAAQARPEFQQVFRELN